MCLKDAHRMTNSVDPDQTLLQQSDQGLHSLYRYSRTSMAQTPLGP